jgi:ClpP class serine protease
LLKCGCHWIDASNVSAEFRELLRPAHTVTQTAGKPRADFGTPEFAERLRDKFAEKIAAQNALRADYIREFADRRAYLTKEETDLPATIADLGAKADAAKVALDAAEKAIADAKTVSPLGADAETLAALARLFLSSQSFHPSL